MADSNSKRPAFDKGDPLFIALVSYFPRYKYSKQLLPEMCSMKKPLKTKPEPDAARDPAWIAREQDRLGADDTPYNNLARAELRAALDNVLGEIFDRAGAKNSRNRAVVVDLVGHNFSYREAAKKYEITPATVQRIEARFLKDVISYRPRLRQHRDDAPVEIAFPALPRKSLKPPPRSQPR